MTPAQANIYLSDLNEILSALRNSSRSAQAIPSIDNYIEAIKLAQIYLPESIASKSSEDLEYPGQITIADYLKEINGQ